LVPYFNGRLRLECLNVLIIAGLMTPWFGVARAPAVLNWLASAGPLLMRLDAGVGMAIGGFLVYLFRTPTRRAT
jgi:hypothetical protein